MKGMLEMWVVYNRPHDYPGQVVVRKWLAFQGEARATDTIITGYSVAEVRAQIPRGLHCQPRDESDDPHIVEVWF